MAITIKDKAIDKSYIFIPYSSKMNDKFEDSIIMIIFNPGVQDEEDYIEDTKDIVLLKDMECVQNILKEVDNSERYEFLIFDKELDNYRKATRQEILEIKDSKEYGELLETLNNRLVQEMCK